MTNIDDKIAKLQAQRDQLNAQIKSETAKKTNAERKKLTRKKILVGAMTMSELNGAELRKKMDNYLTKERDRKLFELEEEERYAEVLASQGGC